MALESQLANAAFEAYIEAPTWKWGDLHARLSLVEGCRVISFRGTTTDPRDWVVDLRVDRTLDPQIGMCHSGFLDAARTLLEVIPLGQIAGAVLAGHSLGGALAVLIGAKAVMQGCRPSAIVTFGAPRAGSSQLKHTLAPLPMRMYRNGNDPVPDVPRAIWPFWGFYAHPRRLLEIGTPRLDPFVAHGIIQYRESLRAVEEHLSLVR